MNEWLKKFAASLTKENRLRINKKMMTLTFFETFTAYHNPVYIQKIGTVLFPYLIVNLFEQRCTSSVKSFKTIYKNNGLNFLKNAV